MPSLLSPPRVNQNTLLIVGNGLNRAVDNSGSWGKLIATLLKRSGYDSVLRFPHKDLSAHTNFVTLFQEISLYWMRKGGADQDIKDFVAEAMESFEESVLQNCELHERLMSLPCKHICTTNYDYVLEESYLQGEEIEACFGNHSETTYSLYRCVALDDKVVWHVHGEGRAPKSINLGHNQYAGHLQYARQYLINGLDSSGRDRFAPLNEKLQRNTPFDEECWLDRFFSARQIVWLGINLPLSEYVLWWLIFYRAEKTQQFKTFYRDHEMHFIDIHAPNEPTDLCWQRSERNRMLRTAGAIVHDRPANGLGSWAEAYACLINEMS